MPDPILFASVEDDILWKKEREAIQDYWRIHFESEELNKNNRFVLSTKSSEMTHFGFYDYEGSEHR